MSFPESGRIETLEGLQALLDRVFDFHDGVLKEVHWLNFDRIFENLHMLSRQGASLRMLIQRQWEDPSAVELTLHDVRRLRIEHLGDYIDGTLAFQEGDEHLRLEFTESTDVVFRFLDYRFVNDGLGNEARFGPGPERGWRPEDGWDD